MNFIGIISVKIFIINLNYFPIGSSWFFLVLLGSSWFFLFQKLRSWVLATNSDFLYLCNPMLQKILHIWNYKFCMLKPSNCKDIGISKFEFLSGALAMTFLTGQKIIKCSVMPKCKVKQPKYAKKWFIVFLKS